MPAVLDLVGLDNHLVGGLRADVVDVELHEAVGGQPDADVVAALEEALGRHVRLEVVDVGHAVVGGDVARDLGEQRVVLVPHGPATRRRGAGRAKSRRGSRRGRRRCGPRGRSRTAGPGGQGGSRRARAPRGEGSGTRRRSSGGATRRSPARRGPTRELDPRPPAGSSAAPLSSVKAGPRWGSFADASVSLPGHHGPRGKEPPERGRQRTCRGAAPPGRAPARPARGVHRSSPPRTWPGGLPVGRGRDGPGGQQG